MIGYDIVGAGFGEKEVKRRDVVLTWDDDEIKNLRLLFINKPQGKQ